MVTFDVQIFVNLFDKSVLVRFIWSEQRKNYLVVLLYRLWIFVLNQIVEPELGILESQNDWRVS